MAAAQGLWLHGNLLTRLPDSIGQLASLRSLSLSGNCLRELPATIGTLSVRFLFACCASPCARPVIKASAPHP